MKKVRGGLKGESLDEARARSKHQSLLQDYQDLQKETRAAISKLQNAKDKKLTLQAEVRFLRQRYNFLMKAHAQNYQPKQDIVLPQKLRAESKHMARINNNATKGDISRPTVPKFESSSKRRVHRKKESTPPTQKPPFVIDLNQNLTNYNAQESTSRHPVPQLDLNQIANDEDEFQSSFEPKRTEERAFLMGLTEDQRTDMTLSACRNIGNAAPNRTRKRKISWQDQLALRV